MHFIAPFRMAKILKFNLWKQSRIPRISFSTYGTNSVSLTQHEINSILRPLYFAVHPDLFHQFPKEKEINENSLKQLNFYLETVSKNVPTNPVSVTFCLKKEQPKETPQKIANDGSFKQVRVQLLGKDIHRVLHDILSTCHLSTEYLDALHKSRTFSRNAEKPKTPNPSPKREEPSDFHNTWWFEERKSAEEIEQRIKNNPDIDFNLWLSENVEKANQKLESCRPLRNETDRLRFELIELLKLKNIVWNCGWGISHFRGCLQSFRTLSLQHPSDMSVLVGRTLVFGHKTGVSFEGHIILSSEDVRSSWLDMIHSVPQYDDLLLDIPEAEKSLSEVLRGISVDRRKFQPTVMVEKYVQQLAKLTSALYKYRWKSGYPKLWPRRLEEFQIVVECEAGPLMLSPTGQFIVPASCPAFLLVDFITKNMEEASLRLQSYQSVKEKEHVIHSRCMSELGLSSLEKDDNITPDLMVQCLERLLRDSPPRLRGLRLRISHYYSVMQDGEICIPWDWKSSNRRCSV